jgi:hypothetical protein
MKRTTLLIMLASFLTICNYPMLAQVNGTAIDPISSTIEDPIYFYIESASDGTVNYGAAQYTGDFRGEVIISPETRGTYLIHNTLASAPNPDYALWALVQLNGKLYLKNKATGYYMIGSHTADTIAKTNEFKPQSLGQNQFLIRTAEVGSYTIAWQNNLCNRWSNSGMVQNGLVAWYFIIAEPEKLQTALKSALNNKIIEATTLLESTKEGEDFGQYTAMNRIQLSENLDNAKAVYEFQQSTINDIYVAIDFMSQVIAEYKATINTNLTVLESTNPDNYRWYRIRNFGYDTPICFNHVISYTNRTAGEKYFYELPADSLLDNQIFRFEMTEDKSKVLNIIDRQGNYMTASGGIGTTSTTDNNFELLPQSDGIAFWIKPSSLAPLRADENGTITNWLYMAGGASSWVLDFVKEMPKIPRFENARTIAVASSNSSQGSAYITETRENSISTDLESVSVTAEPVSGYFFVKWTNEAGDSLGNKLTYVYKGSADILLIAHFEPGYYRPMSRFFTGASPAVQSADRYLTDIIVRVGEAEQIIINDVASIPNPIDTSVVRNQLIYDAVIDYTFNPIVIPLNTDSFELITFGSRQSIENFQWTQQNAFVDWNKDFDFVDENEAGVRNSSNSTDQRLIDTLGYTRKVGIPNGIQEGEYRLRLIYHESATPSTDWALSIWNNNIIRNGTAYDFTIRYGAPTGIKDSEISAVRVYVTDNELNILNSSGFKLRIYDLSGKLLQLAEITSDHQKIAHQLNQGLYIINMISDKGVKYSYKLRI